MAGVIKNFTPRADVHVGQVGSVNSGARTMPLAEGHRTNLLEVQLGRDVDNSRNRPVSTVEYVGPNPIEVFSSDSINFRFAINQKWPKALGNYLVQVKRPEVGWELLGNQHLPQISCNARK